MRARVDEGLPASKRVCGETVQCRVADCYEPTSGRGRSCGVCPRHISEIVLEFDDVKQRYCQKCVPRVPRHKCEPASEAASSSYAAQSSQKLQYTMYFELHCPFPAIVRRI